MFFFQYLEVSFDNQKYLWMRVLLWKFGPLERKIVSGTEDWPWRNLNYIILLSGRLCSITVYMLLDKLLGSVDNQSVSTGSQLSLTTCSWSRDREHSRSHTFLDRDGIKQLLFKSYTPSTSPPSARGFKPLESNAPSFCETWFPEISLTGPCSLTRVSVCTHNNILLSVLPKQSFCQTSSRGR